VVQLVEALRCKPEGRGFDSLTYSFRPHYGPGMTQTLTEMRTRSISWKVKAARA
jgi:hypothetical protein